MVSIMYINTSLVRIVELWPVGGGRLLTVNYFGIGLRRCTDRVIFPVEGMSGRLGEFLPPSLGFDPPLAFATNLQVHTSFTVGVQDVRAQASRSV